MEQALHFYFQNMKEFQPTGQLGKILEEFQAPIEARNSIKRRAELVVARGQLPVDKIESTIVRSMSMHSGLPNWEEADRSIGKTVNLIYRESRPGYFSY